MAAKKKGKPAPSAAEKHVGTVEHYYPKVKAAAVHLDAGLKVGDTIHIKGHSDDYTEKVTSLQMDHQAIAAGRPGEHIGVRVPVKVHEHSEVLKVQPATTPAAAMPKGKLAKSAATKPKRAKAAAKASRKPARKTAKPVRKAPKKAARKAPKGGKKGKAGKRSKGSNKAKATTARKAARKTARNSKRRGR